MKWSLCSRKGVQAFNDKSYKLEHVMLPQELPHGKARTRRLLILGRHGQCMDRGRREKYYTYPATQG